MGLNEGNVVRSVCPGYGKSTYCASLAKTSETVLETATFRNPVMQKEILDDFDICVLKLFL